MSRYSHSSGAHSRLGRRLLFLVIVLIVIILAGGIWVRHRYQQNLEPVSNSNEQITEVISSGESSSIIALQLQRDGLIRSSQAFEWYVTSHNIRGDLQSGTYRFSPNMGTAKIAQMIAHGKVATDLITILPGKNLHQIKNTFIDNGFKPAAVRQAFKASRYVSEYPALADNPRGSSLEGFLYPDSYQLNSSTKPGEIVAEALQQMQLHLTSNIRAGFARQGLSVYQGVTLASIVGKEVSRPADRRQVAQVFLSRLHKHMPLGSDVTALYAKAVHDSRYDTYEHRGLPPGPIANVTEDALQAVANPASTHWLYFLNGDNGHTYFSKTLSQHQHNIDKYCRRKCPATS